MRNVRKPAGKEPGPTAIKCTCCRAVIIPQADSFEQSSGAVADDLGAAQRAEEGGAEGKPKPAGKKRARTVTDVHAQSESAARRLSEAKPRPAVSGQELAFEGGSFRVRVASTPQGP